MITPCVYVKPNLGLKLYTYSCSEIVDLSKVLKYDSGLNPKLGLIMKGKILCMMHLN